MTSLIAKIIIRRRILGLLKLKAVLALKKEISVNFNKAKTKLFLNLHCNRNSSYLFIKGKEIYQIKTDNKKVHFLTEFCRWSISNKCNSNDVNEVSFVALLIIFWSVSILLVNPTF